jgi:hypothetical protein
MPSVEELFCLVALFTLGNPTSAHRCSVDDFVKFLNSSGKVNCSVMTCKCANASAALWRSHLFSRPAFESALALFSTAEREQLSQLLASLF